VPRKTPVRDGLERPKIAILKEAKREYAKLDRDHQGGLRKRAFFVRLEAASMSVMAIFHQLTFR